MDPISQAVQGLSSWQCPVCNNALGLQGGSWVCDSNHSFDTAKEGYVNLLLAQHKNSKEPGDSREMVAARQAFLASQAYLPLAEMLADMTHEHLQSHKAATPVTAPLLFDVGCSEGYYSGVIQKRMLTDGIDCQVAGLDISKPAIQKAAKAYKQNRYAVASSYNMPLANNSVDVALQVFAPASQQEVSRILKRNGIWLLVEPAPEHLHELKAFVYDEAKAHPVKESLPSGFSLQEQSNISFHINLANETDRLNLLKMTPFYWRISPANKNRLLANLESVTTDFTIKRLQIFES